MTVGRGRIFHKNGQPWDYLLRVYHLQITKILSLIQERFDLWLVGRCSSQKKR